MFEPFGWPPDLIYISSETCLPIILLEDANELPLEAAAALKLERLPALKEEPNIALPEAGYLTQPEEADELLPSEFSPSVSTTIRFA